MKDLNKMYKEALSIVEGCGIVVGDIASVKVNTRPTRRYGQCTKRNGRYYINISAFILVDETPYKAVMETIIHEILHTVEGCMNHGAEWKGWAKAIKYTTGYNITTTSPREKFGLEPYEKKGRDNYVFVCEDCGQVIRRSRLSTFVKKYHLYRCGKCGGRFVFDSENSKMQLLTIKPSCLF